MGRGKLRSGLALAATIIVMMAILCLPQPAAAQVSISGNVNVTALVLPNTPTEAAFIDQPLDGEHVTTTPLVVIGRCGAGLLVRILDNGQLAGSVVCEPDSTFVANITLEIGENVLSALNYDAYDQPGPTSPNVTIYVDAPVFTTGADTARAEIEQAVGSAQGTTGSNPAADDTTYGHDPHRLFEGTVIEPLAKILDIGIVVSPSVNSTISIVTNSVFVVALLGLLLIILL